MVEPHMRITMPSWERSVLYHGHENSSTHIIQLITEDMDAFAVVVEDMETAFEISVEARGKLGHFLRG
jgi:hypothetical protein